MRIKWTYDTIAAEALKYKSRNELKKQNRNAYNAAYGRGILDVVCAHMTFAYTDWSDETIAVEALKFKTRRQFQVHSRNAYQTARSRNILDKVCSHMDYVFKTWTNADILLESLKYHRRVDFKIYSSGAYQAAISRGILEDCCKHMPIAKTGFDPDKNSSFYVVRLTGLTESYVGFGISNDVQQRFKEHKRNSSSLGFSLDVIVRLDFETGHSVEMFEKELKSKLPIVSSGVEGFKTEAILEKDEDLLFDAISEWLNVETS